MVTPSTDLIKTRDIGFRPLHPDPCQAQTANRLLTGIDGILEVIVNSPTELQVTYQLPNVSLRIIEESLTELGFHLDNSLLAKMRRAVVYYAEETQCANLGCAEGQSNCTVKVFINRYQRIKHGCRDQRPKHWRKYL